MKKILAIRGKSNTGKSSSIIAAFKYFDKTINIENQPDICITVKVGNQLIGCCSQGDPNGSLCDWLKKLFELGCDIIICACRTRGSTVETVESYNDKGYSIEYFRVDDIQNPLKDEIDSHITKTSQKIIDFILVNTNN